MGTDEDLRLRNAVLAYLAECPNATDTRDAIAEWWVMRQQIRTHVESVGRALEALVAEGVLEEIGSGDERRYRMKRT